MAINFSIRSTDSLTDYLGRVGLVDYLIRIDYTLFIRNHFISNLVQDSLKFRNFRTTKKELRDFR